MQRIHGCAAAPGEGATEVAMVSSKTQDLSDRIEQVDALEQMIEVQLQGLYALAAPGGDNYTIPINGQLYRGGNVMSLGALDVVAAVYDSRRRVVGSPRRI